MYFTFSSLQPVALGSSAKLEVLKFNESDGDFSFHWTKVTGPKNTTTSVTSNELSIENICEGDFGYYRCEVKEAGKVVLTLYRALYRQDSSKVIVAIVVNQI